MRSQQIVQQRSTVLFNIDGVLVQVSTNKVSKRMQTVQQQVVMTKQAEVQVVGTQVWLTLCSVMTARLPMSKLTLRFRFIA